MGCFGVSPFPRYRFGRAPPVLVQFSAIAIWPIGAHITNFPLPRRFGTPCSGDAGPIQCLAQACADSFFWRSCASQSLHELCIATLPSSHAYAHESIHDVTTAACMVKELCSLHTDARPLAHSKQPTTVQYPSVIPFIISLWWPSAVLQQLLQT